MKAALRIGPRGAVAALIIGLLIGMGGWFHAGYQNATAADSAAFIEPRNLADQRVQQLATALSDALAQLQVAENQRPYYQFSNLFHDPKGASQGLSVAPSPLASETRPELIRAYFQFSNIGGQWRVSMPTINDEFPQLSSATTDERNLRDQLQSKGSLIASLSQSYQADTALSQPRSPAQASQQISLTDDQYAQNALGNQIYKQAQVPGDTAAATRNPRRSGNLNITMFGYQTSALSLPDGNQAIAVRTVTTPDGDLLQGYLLSRTGIASWLADRQPGTTVSMEPDDTKDNAHALIPALGPNARLQLPYARSQLNNSNRKAFAMVFAPVALLVCACGALAIWTLLRSDALAKRHAQFAASAAHELRTPLAGIQLYGDMLADNLGDPAKIGTYCRRVSAEASRLGRVVSNMLGVSQLERGAISVRLENEDLSQAVRSIIENLQPGLAANGAIITASCDSPIIARFDRDALTQILANLLDNAEKYSRQSDRHIEIATERMPTWAVVRITDNGPGVALPAARMWRVFERGSHRDQPAGLGIGLALSKHLAQAMAGDITYRRDGARQQSSFEVRLPLIPAAK
jgi:signal transduction histidine kinase